MITIVFAHPWHGSFNHAVLEAVTSKLDGEGREYQVLDLMADGFNPAMTADELALYSRGESADPLVGKYMKALQATDELVLIFPIWWGMMPADLKGFFDKTFLAGCAFNYTPEGAMVPALNIGKTVIATTSQSPSVTISPFIEGYLVPMVLNAVGITGCQWLNCEHTAHGPEAGRNLFLAQVVKAV